MSPMIAEVTNQDCKKVDFDLKKKSKKKKLSYDDDHRAKCIGRCQGQRFFGYITLRDLVF